jgi:hypothetical protein
MKQFLLPVFALSVLAAPVSAQETAPTPEPEFEEGFDLMEEGAKLLLRGLLSEMDPAIEELRGFAEEMGPKMRLFAQEMGPAFSELMAQVDDFSYYTAPEFLPNGDIIIRRRLDAPDFLPQVEEDTGEVEL